jgi:MoaA/NifB/PqqE/SkfB family radical SAM enzyme
MKEEYSSFKAVHHPDRIQQLKEGKQIVPLQLQLIPTNVCQQRCNFCAYRQEGYLSNECFNDKNTIPYDKIIETLDCCVEMGIPSIQLTGGGAPLVYRDKVANKNITDVIKAIIERKLEIALVTNGQGLNEELCQLLGEHASWVRISIDSGTPETYSSIRGVPERIFNKVLDNIKMLVKYNKGGCTIGVGMVVTKENFKETLILANIAKELGVDNIRISGVFTSEGKKYFEGEWLNEAKTLAKEAEKLSDDKFLCFNLLNDRINDNFDFDQCYDKCRAKEFITFLGADQNLYTCCTISYSAKGRIASLEKQSLKDAWFSQEKIDKFDKHNPSKHCKFACLYKNKNLFLEYLTKLNPKHKNYI